MLDVDDPRGVFESVRHLRSQVLDQAEELQRVFLPGIERVGFEESARNLARYLALRRHDLRDLQLALTRWGLSSLGSSEARVLPTLDAVLRTCGLISEADLGPLPAYPAKGAFSAGGHVILEQAEALFGKAPAERATRIMVTLPADAAHDDKWMEELLRAGVECIRINCAHDDRDAWEAMIGNLRRAEQTLGRTEPVRVLMDLGGPKIRTVRPEEQEKDEYHLGDKLLLTALDVEEVSQRKRGKHEKKKDILPVLGCTLPAALEHFKVGESVYIDDGLIRAQAVESNALGVVIEVVQAPAKGRKIRSDKGLNLPDTDFDVAALTEKDKDDLDFVARHADLVGYSFVQTEADVAALLTELGERVPRERASPGLVLKIETKRAVKNLPALIVRAAAKLPTAVMIARGDLAVSLGFARVAEMQEEILWLCEAAHVPVIWATQVLEGLAKEGVTTRAEATDAAMAGRAECVMLNKGPYIIEAVQMLATVLSRMQGHQYKKAPQLRVLHSWEQAFSDTGAEVAGSGLSEHAHAPVATTASTASG